MSKEAVLREIDVVAHFGVALERAQTRVFLVGHAGRYGNHERMRIPVPLIHTISRVLQSQILPFGHRRLALGCKRFHTSTEMQARRGSYIGRRKEGEVNSDRVLQGSK